MGDLTLTPAQRSVLDLEQRLRRMAPFWSYQEQWELTHVLIDLRKAVGLPAVMACGPMRPPARGDVEIEPWMGIPHDSEV